ncbi:MAG: hypothetical protein JO199_13300 [Candidatus Eremiobacteraeota bacterium]|nr:hypothetical protein [Candidatus Eremiobacteraeota bacterium]
MSENAPPPQRSTALPFAIGVVVGLLAGSIFLWLLLLAGSSMLTSALHVKAAWAPLIPCYIVGIALGYFGVREMMKGVGFLGGFMLGAAVGALGSSTLCTLVVGTMSA